MAVPEGDNLARGAAPAVGGAGGGVEDVGAAGEDGETVGGAGVGGTEQLGDAAKSLPSVFTM